MTLWEKVQDGMPPLIVVVCCCIVLVPCFLFLIRFNHAESPSYISSMKGVTIFLFLVVITVYLISDQKLLCISMHVHNTAAKGNSSAILLKALLGSFPTPCST